MAATNVAPLLLAARADDAQAVAARVAFAKAEEVMMEAMPDKTAAANANDKATCSIL